jgi:predicted N-acetyltransferase YhbS
MIHAAACTIAGMTIRIRPVRRDDLPAVYDLLEQSFPEAPRSLFVAQTEHDSTFRLRHGRVALVDGAIAGYVRIFARTMLVRGVPMRAGGIGSVATRPAARRGGVATALLRDAVDQMRRDRMAVSFLFTGILDFYERSGYRVMREPHFEADARDMELGYSGQHYSVRLIDLSRDLPALLSLRRRSTVGATGPLVRTKRTWLDAQHWLGESDSSFVAHHDGEIVAYLRSHCRSYGHRILEAECIAGHKAAIGELMEAMARRQCTCGSAVNGSAPDRSALAECLRGLASTRETWEYQYPMMVLNLTGDPEIDAAFDAEPLHFWNADRI